MIKRRQILIDRTFQHRLAIDLLVIVLVVPAVLWADFYILGQYALSRNPDIGQTGGWGLIGTLITQQWFFMLLVFVLNFALVYGFIVYYTHRIAGPVYRFCRTLDDMADGKLAQLVKLREKDYFENVGTSINRLSDRLCGSVAELKAEVATLSDQVHAGNAKDIQERVAAMEKILARFDVTFAASSAPPANMAATESTTSDSPSNGDVRAES